MRMPNDIPLAAWIHRLADEGKLYRFYKTREWLSLRAEVMAAHHCECAMCAELGKYSKAVTVHHVNEVKDHPELALSKWYIDANGRRLPNLLPLCARCHNRIHDRFNGPRKAADEPKPLRDEIF